MTGIFSWVTTHGSIHDSVSIDTAILSIRILQLCSKGKSYKLSQSSIPLNLTQYSLCWLDVSSILARLYLCMVSRLCEDMVIRFPRCSTSIIHRLQTWEYEIVGYQGIRIPRSSLIWYLNFFLFYLRLGTETYLRTP